MVDEFSQAQVPGEGGRQEQAGIGHQAVVVKEDADTVGIVLWQHLLGAPCFRAGFCSKTIIPDSEEHPLASSRAVPKAVLRWIRAKYVTDANPGLNTVQDLRDHMDLFVTPDSNGKARLLNCPPGWECEVTNTKQVAGYGLDDVIELVNPGSGEALEAEIRASFEKEEPVLFYYWGPTTLSNALSSEYGGYTLLEEPPYTAECWDAERNCGYSMAQVLIVMRKDLIDQAPDLVTFFEKWDFSAANQLEAEGYLGELDGNFSAAADKFLQNNSAWKNWVTSDAASKVEAAVGS